MPCILVKGDAQTPERFWERVVCKEHEFTNERKTEGWVKTNSLRFLSDKQIAYLKDRQL